jgi:general secretion pathway protein M
MNSIRAWYRTLKERERKAVLLGGVAVSALVLVAGILMPLHASVAKARDLVESQREDLAWMQQNAPELRAANGTFSGPSNESPIVLVDRTGREAGLSQSLRGTQPSGNSGVRVQLEAAPFDALVSWLAALEQRHGVAIESITIDRAAKPGLVNVSVSLTQAHH